MHPEEISIPLDGTWKPEAGPSNSRPPEQAGRVSLVDYSVIPGENRGPCHEGLRNLDPGFRRGSPDNLLPDIPDCKNCIRNGPPFARPAGRCQAGRRGPIGSLAVTARRKGNRLGQSTRAQDCRAKKIRIHPSSPVEPRAAPPPRALSGVAGGTRNLQSRNAACRARVCQYVYISVVTVTFKKQTSNTKITT